MTPKELPSTPNFCKTVVVFFFRSINNLYRYSDLQYNLIDKDGLKEYFY